MNYKEPSVSANDIRPLVRRLRKLPEDWQREDLINYCLGQGVRIVNFRYPALDGKLKELRIPVNNKPYLERILAAGERVDGSSLFPGLFAATKSDLYVLPVYKWAFINPWAEDELDIVCRFANKDGEPCAETPDNILAGALREALHPAVLDALAELEFYIFVDPEHPRFTGRVQRNYHQSAPYLRSRPIADEILRVVSMVTGRVKYCHSEVGYMDKIYSGEAEIDGTRVEQYELEFSLMPIEDLGCWLTVARWLIRVIAGQLGATVTYLPKLDEGMAGNGMHFHLAVNRGGVNVMTREDGSLSDDAYRLIGGLLDKAVPLTAFGNTVAASYLRLVPGQEAPTSVCWGYHNRAGLIRVPLSFSNRKRLDKTMNPNEKGDYPDNLSRPTVEYRSPAGSAFSHMLMAVTMCMWEKALPSGHMLMAAVTMCAEKGLTSADSLERARALEVTPERPAGHKTFGQLPETAVAAAHALEAERAFFEERGFASRLIDIVVDKLKDEADVGLSDKLRALPAAERLAASRRLMHKDLHKH